MVEVAFVVMLVDLVDDIRVLLRIPPGEGDVDVEPLPSNLKSSSLRRPANVGGGGVRSSSCIVASGEAMAALFFFCYDNDLNPVQRL